MGWNTISTWIPIMIISPDYFTNIQDTIKALITEAKDNYELDELDLYYSFKRINLVEVPIQYHAYERPYSQTVENILPEMILMPEKGAGINTLDFERYKKAEEKRRIENEENSRSPREIEIDQFKRFLQNTFFQKWNPEQGRRLRRRRRRRRTDYFPGRYQLQQESLLCVPPVLQLCYRNQFQGLPGIQLHAGNLPEGGF